MLYVLQHSHKHYHRKDVKSAVVYLEYGRALFENAKHQLSDVLSSLISSTLRGEEPEDGMLCPSSRQVVLVVLIVCCWCM
jgi:hypothetical protein